MAVNFGYVPYRAMRARIISQGEVPAWCNQWKLQRILATPPWQQMGPIRRVYAQAQKRTRETGVRWTVGHIVPLNHPRVCGLHVHWNLQLEPAAANFSKGNDWCDHHGELFDEPEQFKLF